MINHQNSKGIGCTHCACNNPMWNVLKENLFHEEHLLKMAEGLKPHFHAETEAESLIIYGGIIRPLIDGKMDTVEAIGIHQGKVVATGNKNDIEIFMNSQGINFKYKELQEKEALLPGLIEPHVHIVQTALLMGWLDLGRFDSQVLKSPYNEVSVKDTITRHVEKHRLKYAAGAWILGKSVDPALMPFEVKEGELNQLVTFTCDSLDEMVTDIPLLMLSASMHTAYLNTKALQLTYTHNYEELKAVYPDFDTYKSKTKGQLQEEAGMTPALKTIPLLQLGEMVISCFSNLKQLFKEANSRGATFLYDAGMNDNFKSVLDLYNRFNPKNVRIGAGFACTTQEQANKLPKYETVTVYEDVYYGNVKLFSDGSNQGLTGYQSVPYCCAPAGNVGQFSINGPGQTDHPPVVPEYYRTLVQTIADKGWPLMIHANGDLAIKFAIEVYDQSSKNSKAAPKRNRIEHCSLLSDEHIADMKRLEISPSFLIGHVGYWGYAFRNAIFEEKAELLDRCKSALDAGLRISLHSDFEVSPLGPLRMMEQSITRIMEAAPGKPEDNVLNAAECITPEQALRAVTTDAAWQCFAENWVGSLAVGHFSDFVILAQDPLSLEINYLNMRDIPVLETWKGGSLVYVPELVTSVN